MPVCYRYESNELDARAQLNLGFLKICQNLDKYPRHIPFEVWTRRIMINTIIDEYRRSKSYKEKISIREHEYELEFHAEPEMNDVSAGYEYENATEMLKVLPEMTRKVFNLYLFEGYTHKEIGELLNISQNTSKWHLHFGKNKLRSLYMESMKKGPHKLAI